MMCANHRSWADFIVDMALLGNPIALSRLAVRCPSRSLRASLTLNARGGQVMLALPMTGLYSWLFGTAIIFQRGKALLGRCVATISKETIGLQQPRRTDEFVGIPPE